MRKPYLYSIQYNDRGGVRQHREFYSSLKAGDMDGTVLRASALRADFEFTDTQGDRYSIPYNRVLSVKEI